MRYRSRPGRNRCVRHRATTALFWEAVTPFNNQSYTFAGDINGDGGSANNLIYIHRDISEMNFVDCSVVVCDQERYTFSAAQQEAAWNAFIDQDRPRYRLRSVGNQLISESFEPTIYVADVFRIRFSLRYTLT